MRHANLFEKHAAGAESNIAIGVSRLGHRAALITKLGFDQLSKFVLSTLKGEGVETKWIKQVDGKSCGIFVVQRNYPVPGKSDLIYYRNDSAARLLSPADISEDAIRQSQILQLSGITPALSDSCRKACFRAIDLAEKHGVKFSFDPNYRRRLWSVEDARPVFLAMAKRADILFSSPEEAEIMLRRRFNEERTLEELSRLGPKTVVLKLGAKKGLLARTPQGRARAPSYAVPVVDVIGAGDSAVAGFLSGLLSGEKLGRSLKFASACSALTVMRRGDFENLPTRDDLEKFLLAFEKGVAIDER
jgi:sugar/nucleoside kinase (ribokinase family)